MIKNDSTVSVRTKDLWTGYRSRKGETVISEGIDATLQRGELTCLLGPNGAGKSTLLKTLSGFLPPLRGEICVEGRAWEDFSERELSRTVSVVLTERLSVTNMTAVELVALGRSPYTGFSGALSEDDRHVVRDALAAVGIDEMAQRTVQTLSDGERQKVMIAKSLAQETPIIYLDEPTAFLDYPSKVEIMLLLQRLARERGKTVFLSTHDLEMALQIADRVWLLDKVNGLTVGVSEDLALDGALGRYFDRGGLRFDAAACDFRISHAIHGEVGVIIDEATDAAELRCSLLRKALGRVGYAAVDDAKASVVVRVGTEGYLVDGRRMNSIGEAIEAVNEGLS